MNLENCPFCGTPVYAKVGHADITFFMCLHTEGGCGAVVSFSPYKMGEKAAEAFNRRTVKPEADDRESKFLAVAMQVPHDPDDPNPCATETVHTARCRCGLYVQFAVPTT